MFVMLRGVSDENIKISSAKLTLLLLLLLLFEDLMMTSGLEISFLTIFRIPFFNNTGGSLFWIQIHQFVHNMVTQVLVDDPVHKLEAGESYWKYYT